MIFFLLAGAWFVRVAGRECAALGQRLVNCYYAVMMAAMAWMYALMNWSVPGRVGHRQAASAATEMAGMDKPAQRWITTVNWTVTLGFAVVAMYWLCHYVIDRRRKPVPHTRRVAGLELLYQATAAAGTALMFAVML